MDNRKNEKARLRSSFDSYERTWWIESSWLSDVVFIQTKRPELSDGFELTGGTIKFRRKEVP